MSNEENDPAQTSEQTKNWWGTTLGKLKTALVRTKSAVVDSVVDRTTEGETQVQELAGINTGAAQSQSVAPQPPPPPRPIDEDYLEDVEEKLIRADLGLPTVELLCSHLRKEAKAKNWNSRDVEAFLKSEFTAMLADIPSCALRYTPGTLNIYMVVGVNGTGKTTSIGKLSWRL
jgi:signal recognition particle GTPase